MFYKIHGIRALIYHNKKLLILKRASNDKDDAGLWDIPGGAIKTGESIFDAVKREILEETDIESGDLIIKDLRGLIVDDFKGDKKLSIAVFSCQSATANIKFNSEHSKYLWINPEKLSSHKLGRILKTINS